MRHVVDSATPDQRAVYDAALSDARARARADRSIRGSSEDPAYLLMSRALLPANPGELLDGIRLGDLSAMEKTIAWLELDPFCLWSGYWKQRYLRALAWQALPTELSDRLRKVLVADLQRGRRMELRTMCRLARALNTEDFRERLRRLRDSGDEDLRERAGWMLDGCERALKP